MSREPKSDFLTPFLAGALAWLIPGAGHVFLRRPVRGLILCAVINALFWSGFAIGGTFTVEPTQERWWYMAQMCTGVSGLAAWHRQKKANEDINLELRKRQAGAGLKSYQDELHDKQEVVRDKQLALTYPGDIVARAYSGIAGMLNLMCIFDAVMLAMMGRIGEPPPKTQGPAEAKS